MDEKIPVGRVLRASTSAFTVGCRQLIAEQDLMTPKLGALLKATGRNGRAVYGLTCNVTIEDDAFVRQLVAAGVESAEIIEDQRQKRQVPIVVEVMIVGHGDETTSNCGSGCSEKPITGIMASSNVGSF